MRRLSFFIFFQCIVFIPAMAQKVYVDYDKDADFDAYTHFVWMDTVDVSLRDTSPLMDSRIKNAIEHKMTEAGMIEDEKNPNFFITYYCEEKKEVRLDTTHYGYGYGPRYVRHPYWGGYGASTTDVRTYTKGTLIIDVIDSKTKTLVWRATATSTISADPEKSAKKMEKAVKKIAKKWQKMKKKGLGD